jgi:hypothetical protein
MSLSRPTASKVSRKLTCAATICLGLLGYSATSALAETGSVTATCEGQAFSQPFASLKDSNYYTLVEGGEFNSPSEGWELSNGAQIVEGTRPDGSTGGILDLPSGAVAVSPVTCVTLLYPTARMYVRNVKGGEGVSRDEPHRQQPTERGPGTRRAQRLDSLKPDQRPAADRRPG